MKFLINALLLSFILINISCSSAEIKDNSKDEIALTGSTPGDSLINSLLGIRSDTIIDFIRWELTLNNNPPNNFQLNINYGVCKPNTNGFMGGGEKGNYKGKCTISKSTGSSLNGEIYQLTGEGIKPHISLIKLNDNLFHLLTPENKLMIGNGGWSYSLNRKTPLADVSTTLPALTNAQALLNDTTLRTTFQGRTPCPDFAREYQLQFDGHCYKLKWGLTLLRDPKTYEPSTYKLNRTLHRSGLLTGKWEIAKGAADNPDAVILQLDPDMPDASVSFLVGDENVIFFLDKKKRLFSGDHDFSYTLNRSDRHE